MESKLSKVTDPYDPASEGAEMAFAGRMSYSDYLQIDAAVKLFAITATV